MRSVKDKRGVAKAPLRSLFGAELQRRVDEKEIPHHRNLESTNVFSLVPSQVMKHLMPPASLMSGFAAFIRHFWQQMKSLLGFLC